MNDTRRLVIGAVALGVIATLLGGGLALAMVVVFSARDVVRTIGSDGGGRDGSARVAEHRPTVELTDPVTNPPKPMPLIRPGNVSAPDWVDPVLTRDQCDDLADGGPVHGPGCLTGEIACDQTVIGHTVGGVERFDTKFYEKKFCWPATIDHDGGGERVYRLRMPPGEWRAWVTLHSPCADLDVAGIRWDSESCPDMGSNIHVCEMKPEKGSKSERIELTSQTFDGQEAIWYVVVEGKNDEEGPFSLHVQCSRGLGGPLR